KYLTRFGYLTSTITPGTLDKSTSQALDRFQQVMGLKASGTLNEATVNAMQQPRCGTPDIGVIERATGGTSANFVLRGCSYNKTQFTFRFVTGTTDIPNNQEQNAVRRAFNTWAQALCGVTFEERATGAVDFEIGWFAGDHGDGSNFDGDGNDSGNVLAHAFYPPPCGGDHAGECHFDEAETWSLNGNGSTIDIETVALHEIGHLLGLEHSRVSGSVMFPNYPGVLRTLTQDDIDGIRMLYPFVCRRGDSGGQAGFVSEIAAARHNKRQVITAVQAQNGSLKLIAWRVSNDGSIARTGDSADQAGAATSIAISRNLDDTRFITACRNGSNRLFLISWDINADGTTISRLADSGSLAGNASLIRIVCVSKNRFVTACRAGDGSLKLIGWQLKNDGSLIRLAESGTQAGKVLDIALVTVSSNRVITAVRTASGGLKLISWKVSDTEITRLADSGDQAGEARMIRATIDQAGNVVTAIKAGNNNLMLITWSVSSTGKIKRLKDAFAGETNGHDISMAKGKVITGVRTGSGHLKVIVWETNDNGNIARIGDSANLAGDASLITQCEEFDGAPPIVTSVRAANNSLKMISWGSA
ncbi:MAG TPA: matrixin family metalloprotease, partial [Chitinophagales bacterium]|nr:matrixin family metalloprotease [Chitinophagales bacterium]